MRMSATRNFFGMKKISLLSKVIVLSNRKTTYIFITNFGAHIILIQASERSENMKFGLSPLAFSMRNFKFQYFHLCDLHQKLVYYLKVMFLSQGAGI